MCGGRVVTLDYCERKREGIKKKREVIRTGNLLCRRHSCLCRNPCVHTYILDYDGDVVESCMQEQSGCNGIKQKEKKEGKDRKKKRGQNEGRTEASGTI